MVFLDPSVIIFVHPIDTQVHPSYPPGYRWAVMMGSGPADLDHCANAGWCPTEREAELEGAMCGVTAVKALRMLGCPATYALRVLSYDPIPASADDRPIGVFGD